LVKSNFVRDAWLKELTKVYQDKDIQTDVQKAITEGPEEYRKKVTTDEYRLAGIPEDSEGEKDEYVEMVVNKRMMTESPMLNEYKLVNKGGILTPDLVQQRKIKPEKVK
tara:strand:- start:720 stop:1046 length:327 start_codon:yes stop_codon:yes gene_type:complete